MENNETAANPADAGPVTLADPVQEARTLGQQSEATAQAGGAEDTIEALTKEALGEPDPANPLEEHEIEWDGIKAKVPAPLKDAFLRHADYTRKTMELSEARKTFETEQAAFKQSATQIAANFQGFAQLASMNAEIQRIAALDTTGWSQADIDAGTAQLRHLQAQAGQLNHALTTVTQQRTAAEQRQFEQSRKAAFGEAQARIPNFTEDRWQQLKTDAATNGVPADALDLISEPWEYETLHFADIGRKFVERQRKAASMKAAHAGQPATMLGGASSGGKDPASMSMDEFAAWREAGNG